MLRCPSGAGARLLRTCPSVPNRWSGAGQFQRADVLALNRGAKIGPQRGTLSGSAPTRPATARCRRPLAGLVELGLQFSVDGLEGQDGSDPGQIEAVVEEPADLSETDEVVIAVAAGATSAAGRIDQAPGLVEPQVLGSATHQLGGDGDSVQAPSCIGTVSCSAGRPLRKFVRTTCLGHGHQDITNL